MIRNFISKLYSLYTPSFFISGGGSAGGYVIERSLRFSSASSQYLTRTFSTPTNNTIWTWSKWLKRGSLGSIQGLFSAGSAGVFFNASDQLIFTSNAGATLATSTKVFRDPTAHGHLKVSSDGTTITAHWNNELCLSYTGTITNINSAIAHNIGRNAGGSNQHFDGYDSEDVFVDGQSLASSSFGETNTATGQWVAKKYTGTYGTNGSYQDFKDGTSTTTLGYDKSGNNNHWTLTNFTRSSGVNDCWMLDVPAGNGSASAVQPSGNYAVLNPLRQNGSGVFLNGNLSGTSESGTSRGLCSSIVLNRLGKWYCEVTPTSSTTNWFGVTANDLLAADVNTAGQQSVMYYADGTKRVNGSASAYGSSFTTQTIGMAFDGLANTITFYRDNVTQGAITLPSSTVDYVFFMGNAGGGGVTNAINFGQRSFAYTPPTGFKALCTVNLPTPSIKKPSDHFKVQLSTGANIKTDSEALFTNELEWIKDRANANNHQLIDSVRGSNAVLQSNTIAAETTYTAPSGSSVGWVWRASDSAPVTNTNGSISSQVSANVAAGFSIVTYTGNGVNATVGHGLGIAPKMLIIKERNGSTYSWTTYHVGLSNATQYVALENTFAQGTRPTAFNSTEPASTVFSVGTDLGTNGLSTNFVAYCFAEIPGYSKFGRYTGNGSADGTNVTLGFKPAFVMIKRTDTTSNWTMFDNQRDGYNVDNDQFYANTTGAEVTTDLMDLLSNGFKSRSSDASINANGGTYIYWAFAETPFNYANAR